MSKGGKVMNKQIIRISTDSKVTVHDYPSDNYSEQNIILCELIGNNCDIYEHLMPKRLYTVLKCNNTPRKSKAGVCVSMLIDECGLLKENEPNIIGSWLYETDIHGDPIMGNILLVGEMWENDGISFCGIDEEVMKTLYPKVQEIAKKIKDRGEK